NGRSVLRPNSRVRRPTSTPPFWSAARKTTPLLRPMGCQGPRRCVPAPSASVRAAAGNDLISVLIAACEGSDILSDKEMLAFLVLLLVAGSETTTNLIGNRVLALLRNPVELKRLRRQPELIHSAVEEMLRFDGPGPGATRVCTVETGIGGTVVANGSFVLVLTAAANRDPAYFNEPDKFDITRVPNNHLAFSEGIHFCLGA